MYDTVDTGTLIMTVPVVYILHRKLSIRIRNIFLETDPELFVSDPDPENFTHFMQ